MKNYNSFTTGTNYNRCSSHRLQACFCFCFVLVFSISSGALLGVMMGREMLEAEFTTVRSRAGEHRLCYEGRSRHQTKPPEAINGAAIGPHK